MATIEQQARDKIYRAITCGRMKRATHCEKCGKAGGRGTPIHAHHDDYTKPLDVRWLCGSCHKRHHLALRKAAA
jgi:hypothetical protein